MRNRCECGGRLTWEARETYRGKRWLAFCGTPDCGRFTTQIADGFEDPDGLQRFLLDGQPPAPYVKPWVRFFLRSAESGFSWRSSTPCAQCSDRLVMELHLPRDAARAADPDLVVLCLSCGQLAVRLWALGDVGEIHLDGRDWSEPCIAIRALKRAIADRAGVETDGWDFE